MIGAIRAQLSKVGRRSAKTDVDTRWWHWDGSTWQPPAGWVWDVDRWVPPGPVSSWSMRTTTMPAAAPRVEVRDELTSLLDELANAS